MPICLPTEPSIDQPSSPAAASTELRSRLTSRASCFKVPVSWRPSACVPAACPFGAGSASALPAALVPRLAGARFALDASASGTPSVSRNRKVEQALTNGSGVFFAPKP